MHTTHDLVIGHLDTMKCKNVADTIQLIPIFNAEREFLGYLEPITKLYQLQFKDITEKLTVWRNKNNGWMFSEFVALVDKTTKWIDEQLIDGECILFIIVDKNHDPIGHIGLSDFIQETDSAEIYCVMRGEKAAPGIMKDALNSLINWSTYIFKLKKFVLCVFADNVKAVKLYEKCGFTVCQEKNLRRISQEEGFTWVDNFHEKQDMLTRTALVMEKNV